MHSGSDRRLACVVAVLALTLAGCGAGDTPPPDSPPDAGASAGGFPVTVEHSLGSTTIEREPSRIVTLGATDADIVLALGVEPVGIRSPYGFERGVGPWAEDELTGSPTVLGREIDYETVAALEPDLIVNVFADGEQAAHDILTRIAPTVALPSGARPFAPTWQDSTRLIAQSLGRPADGERLVEGTEDYLAIVAAANPEYAGATLTYLDVQAGQAYVGSQDATAVELMGELGFQSVPFVRDLSPDRTQNLVSPELISEVDADVLLVYSIGSTDEEAVTSTPGLADLDAVRDDRTYFLPDLSLSAPSVLSIPYGIDALVPFLQAAVPS